MSTRSDPSQVRISGPMAGCVEGFAGRLAQQGYAPGVVLFHLRLMAQLSVWLQDRDLGVAVLDRAMLEEFLTGRRAAGYVAGLAFGSLEPLLEYLRSAGMLEAWRPAAAGAPVDVLLERYAGYLARERGLAATTIERELVLVRPFLLSRVRGQRLDLARLSADQVIAFVLEQARLRPAGLPRTATALRSLLRFLHVDGLAPGGLAEAVPSAAARKLSGLPKALTGEQVAALLDSCDLGSAVGRRNFAIMTVLSRLGLRAGELAALRLEDIDWRRGEITVRGKANRAERLPLPADVGRAVVAYLAEARPATVCRAVFVCARAPHRPMSRGAVTNVVAAAARRSGMGTVHAHRLRHSVATAMLGAGASLTEIGQTLRHRDLLTTAIYAKVDIAALRALARPWPGADAA